MHMGRQRADRGYTVARPTGEGERGTWQGRTSRGRGARTDGCGPASASVYGGRAARHNARARPALWSARGRNTTSNYFNWLSLQVKYSKICN
jgi:hypothetical protein